MIDGKIAQKISNIFKSNYLETPEEFELKEFHKRVIQTASSGKLEFVYKPDNPLSKAAIIIIKDLGFNIKEEGYQYKVSWK